MSPTVLPVPNDFRDHEVRLRKLEAERVTDQRLEAIERRVHALELTAAKAVVVIGAVAFVASAAASALVSLAMQAILGG